MATLNSVREAIDANPNHTSISAEVMLGLYEKHLGYCEHNRREPMSLADFVADEIEQDWQDREMNADFARRGIDPSYHDE